ncbi:MAG: hypothetical protein RI935_431 [Candidatus Parcubacteria bacterium]|jgi:hypothetical protein
MEKDNTISPLDRIEHELYDPKNKDFNADIHRVKSTKNVDLPTSWGEDGPILVKKEDKKFSFGLMFFLFSLITLLLVLLFTAYRVISLQNVVSAANIDTTLEITPFVEGGDTVPLVVTLRNNNKVTLEDVTLTLLYKQGSSSEDEQEKIQEKRPVGAVAKDEFKRQDFSLSLYGREGESRDITVKLEYKVPGSNATFNKIVTTDVIIETPPVSVSVKGPEVLSVGQEGTFIFTVENNSSTSSPKSVLLVTFPQSFEKASEERPPLPRTTSWEIPSIKKGEKYSFFVKGFFKGRVGEVASIVSKLGSQSDSNKVLGIVYSSTVKDVTLRKSPLDTQFSLSSTIGGDESITYADRVTVVISYKNAGSKPLENVVLRLALDGDAIIYNDVAPNKGYYDSQKKTITWDASLLPDLRILPPGGQGTLVVSMPTVTSGFNSPTLSLSLVSEALDVSDSDVTNVFSKTYAIKGSASLEARTSYANGSLNNTGPIPPVANNQTTYTVSLSISAQNAIKNAKVSFTLPFYVSWRDVYGSGQSFSYDARTRTVSFNAGALNGGETKTGEVSLAVKPSLSQRGTSPAITSAIVLEADEVLSKNRIKITFDPITTFIKGENWPTNPSLVTE